jgi:uncharacterized protein YcbX
VGAAPQISALYIYPVKSCAGIVLGRSELLSRGLAYDRRFVIADETGRFITQREEWRLALVRTRIEGEALSLTSPAGHVTVPLEPRAGTARRVTVWDDEVDVFDADARASEMLSAHLERRVFLCFMPDASERRIVKDGAQPGDIVSFADAFPVLVCTEASLADLNEKLAARGREAVPMARFRPNVVVSGTRAFEEEERESLIAGSVHLALVRPSDRCGMVNVNQDTAAYGKEPLATLATYRTKANKTYFGENAFVRQTGTIAVGDAVTWG